MYQQSSHYQITLQKFFGQKEVGPQDYIGETVMMTAKTG